jgi:UDP-N-acetyl-2-amino-2-deoxyglucuronate dehydrogenase
LLIWLFGPVVGARVHLHDDRRMAGFIELERANVRWFLSVDARDLPPAARAASKVTHRSITVDGTEIEFSDGFTDLHTRVYERTLRGDGFGIDDARPSIELGHLLRTAPLSPAKGRDVHPMLET